MAAAAGGSWTFDPVVVVSLVVVAAAYGKGVRRLQHRSPRAGVLQTWRVIAFGAGLATVIAALVSPLDSLSGDLLSAHMGQHLLLVLVAAPLLVTAVPALPLILALPVRWRRRMHWLGTMRLLRTVRRFIAKPLAVWILQFVALWSWHLPSLYEAAVRSDFLHALQHATFLGTALLFWWVVIEAARGGRRRIAPGHDVLYVVLAGVQGSVLGALLTFASSPLYRIYVERTAIHGVGALEDQQLAGLVMWIPGGAVYLAAAAILFVRWLRTVEDGARREEATSLAVATK